MIKVQNFKGDRAKNLIKAKNYLPEPLPPPETELKEISHKIFSLLTFPPAPPPTWKFWAS